MTTLEFLLTVLSASLSVATWLAVRHARWVEGRMTELRVLHSAQGADLDTRTALAREWKTAAVEAQKALIGERRLMIDIEAKLKKMATKEDLDAEVQRARDRISEALKGVTDRLAEKQAVAEAPIPDPPSTREADRRVMEARRKVAAQMDGYQPVAFSDKKVPPVPRLTEKL